MPTARSKPRVAAQIALAANKNGYGNSKDCNGCAPEERSNWNCQAGFAGDGVRKWRTGRTG
jgi:hypothetical protein